MKLETESVEKAGWDTYLIEEARRLVRTYLLTVSITRQGDRYLFTLKKGPFSLRFVCETATAQENMEVAEERIKTWIEGRC